MSASGGEAAELALGKRLQAARQGAGMTQQELCSAANLSYSTLAKIERGAIRSPSIFTIQSIASALHVSLDELVGTPAAPQSSAKKTSQNGVKFVYFDLNGCLVRFASRAFTKLAEDSGHALDVVESVFWQHNSEVCRGDMSLDAFNTVLAERLGIMVDWKQYYLSAVDKMPAIDELVQWVAQNYSLGIMSNTMPGLIAGLQEKGMLPAVHYDTIVDSSAVHALKPEPEMYEAALAQSGVIAGEILLIDDDRSNLSAAQQAGWKTIWFDSYNPEESIAAIQAALQPAD